MVEPRQGVLGDRNASDEEVLATMEWAYLAAAERHRAAGVPMIAVVDGEVVEIPPDRLPRLADRFPHLAAASIEAAAISESRTNSANPS